MPKVNPATAIRATKHDLLPAWLPVRLVRSQSESIIPPESIESELDAVSALFDGVLTQVAIA